MDINDVVELCIDSYFMGWEHAASALKVSVSSYDREELRKRFLEKLTAKESASSGVK